MRLLWEESVFGVVGAFCVAAFALGATWTLLEGVLELNGVIAGMMATVTAVATLEAISRRQHEPGRSSPARAATGPPGTVGRAPARPPLRAAEGDRPPVRRRAA